MEPSISKYLSDLTYFNVVLAYTKMFYWISLNLSWSTHTNGLGANVWLDLFIIFIKLGTARLSIPSY